MESYFGELFISYNYSFSYSFKVGMLIDGRFNFIIIFIKSSNYITFLFKLLEPYFLLLKIFAKFNFSIFFFFLLLILYSVKSFLILFFILFLYLFFTLFYLILSVNWQFGQVSRSKMNMVNLCAKHIFMNELSCCCPNLISFICSCKNKSTRYIHFKICHIRNFNVLFNNLNS